jgi:hypothetical protein
MEALETHEYKDRILKIYHDQHPTPPNEWDGEATLVIWSREYSLDEDGYIAYGDPEDFIEWAAKSKAFFLPVYAYSHGGLTISTSPYSCQWDSGPIGFIYITREQIKDWGHDWKYFTKGRKQQIKEWLEATVKVWDQYLTGDVYGFELVESAEECEEEIDSCWGIYGREEIQLMTEKFSKTGEVSI